MRRNWLVAVSAIALLGIGLDSCSDQGPKKHDLVPAAMSIVSGQHQSGRVGEELAQPIVARVLNSAGDPIAGQLVNFRVLKGDGSVFAGAALTNADGVAQERWTLGKSIADSQVVEARAVNSSTGEALVFARFIATARAGPPAVIQQTAGNSQSAMIGTELPVTLVIRVLDAYGNAIAALPVDWGVATGGGTVAHAKDTTSESGYASNAWTLGSDVGEQTVRTSVSTDVSATFTANGSPKLPAQVAKYAGDGQSAAPGTVVGIAPSVRVIDNQGNPAVGIAVTFAVTGGGGTVTPATVVSNDGGVAAVSSWRLGDQAGINTLSATAAGGAVVTFTATAVHQSADINLYVGPPNNGLVGDTIAVRAVVTSTAQIASVKATVSNRTVSLAATAPGQWSGIVSLVGAPRDTMTFVATATDVNGQVAQVIRSLVHDRPPRLILAQPRDNSVARPDINIAAQCDDDDDVGCTLTVRTVDGQQLIGPSPILNTPLSLSAFDGQRVQLMVEAKDSRGQYGLSETRVIWVESSSRLQLIGSAEGKVIDASDARLLWVSGYYDDRPPMGVRSVPDGVTDTLVMDISEQVSRAFLTPTGAAFTTSTSLSPGAKLYIWRNRNLSTMPLPSSASLDAGGSYILYSPLIPGAGLVRTDVVTGADVTIAALNASVSGNSVAENGNVAYETGYNIALYNGSSTIAITSDVYTSHVNVWPVTDGTNVVFIHRPWGSSGSDDEIWLYDGATTSVLSPARNKGVVPGGDYVVNAGWVAFTKIDAAFIAQVWTRSPTGTLRAVSAVGASALIRALASDGSVVFDGGTSRYLAGPASAPQRISAANGTVVWRDGRFVMLLGNSAFAISP